MIHYPSTPSDMFENALTKHRDEAGVSVKFAPALHPCLIPISLTYIAVAERSGGECRLAIRTEVGELSPRIKTGQLAVRADKVKVKIALQADQV